MKEEADGPGDTTSGRDYRSLPPPVRLEETVVSVDPDPVPDPEAGQNVDQRRALQDD